MFDQFTKTVDIAKYNNQDVLVFDFTTTQGKYRLKLADYEFVLYKYVNGDWTRLHTA